MRKTNRKGFALSPLFCGFLAVALLFLAFGLGMLGSFETAGADYEFNVSAGDQKHEVVFSLSSSVTENVVAEDGTESTKTVASGLRVTDVYVYATGIYSPVGTSAGLLLERGTSRTSYSSTKYQGALENVYYTAPETTEGVKKEDLPLAPTAEDALYHWTQPFDLGEGYSVSSYSYARLTATTHTLRIAEVVFVGRSSDSADETLYVVPAKIDKATPVVGETAEAAALAAGALLDAQPAEPPTPAQSSFTQFTDEEVYSLLTINEMSLGNRYPADASGNVLAVYNGDRVYGALGNEILALGVGMFGASPFGLRFFPMLAAFFTLIVGYIFVKRLTGSERGGLVFSVLYVFCCMTMGLAKLGTPLFLGVFFFALSLCLCHGFYARGMRHTNILGALPLIFSGLFGALAILVNGAFVVPVAGVAALYVLGMVRQQYAKKRMLAAALEEQPSSDDEEETPEKRAAKVVAEYRYKNVAAGIAFPAALLLGTALLSLLFMLPAYYVFVKLYDNPASPALNILSLGWKSFVGGFVGENVGAMPPVYHFGYKLFAGTGNAYAVSLVCINAVAAVAALVGLGFALYRVISALRVKDKTKEEKKTLRTYLVPLASFALCLATAFFAGGGYAFLVLALCSLFALAAAAHEDLAKAHPVAAKAVSVTAVVLLVLAFAAAFVFVFSVPLPAGFMEKLF